MSITFSTGFYVIKSKYDVKNYIEWMNNFISIVNHFYLVIYTDENSFKYIDIVGNSKIKVIIKPFEQFYNYKYKDTWIKNHEKNNLLNERIDWTVNMLWSEKIWFVKETAEKNYFKTQHSHHGLYGWCDIGYFRNRYNDLHTKTLGGWCSNIKQLIDIDKIYYACINNNNNEINNLYKIVNNKNKFGLPIQPIPVDKDYIAGGFFIVYKNKINWWAETYNRKLELYFNHNYLVKDDQTIVNDCIMSNLNHFKLYRENNRLDNWFMFQRILMPQQTPT